MSCCDGSLLYINNQVSGQTVDITSVKTDNNTGLSGIAVGDSIASGTAEQGSVQSANGSNGAAEGQIGISVDGVAFTLNYDFKPKNHFGKCPCTPAGSASPSSSGDYNVTVKHTKGENSGAVLNFYVNESR